MTIPDILAVSMLCTVSGVLGYLWRKRESKQGGLLHRIKLPELQKGLDVKDMMKELSDEPTIKEEIALDQKFIEKFAELNDTKEEIGNKLKMVNRDSDDLWDEIRKFYKIGDYNLSLSEDRKTLQVKNISKIEQTLSSIFRK